MTVSRDVKIFLENSLLDSALKGQHNFIGLMQQVLEQAGHRVQFLPEKGAQVDADALSLVHMRPPLGRHGLTFRRVYHYPYWQIETTDRRWAWDVARERFAPASAAADQALRFQRFWRKRLYEIDDVSDTPTGPVFVPLQGRLSEHRSFQTMSPLDMVSATLTHETEREVIATLHPKEVYSRHEIHALEALVSSHPRLTLERCPAADILPHCAYVVTQNSSVAFDGFLFNKPAILFAKIDFHHIAKCVMDMPVEEAFARVMSDRPEFAAYVHWFWQEKSINAGRPEAADKIAARFVRLGWPM